MTSVTSFTCYFSLKTSSSTHFMCFYQNVPEVYFSLRPVSRRHKKPLKSALYYFRSETLAEDSDLLSCLRVCGVNLKIYRSKATSRSLYTGTPIIHYQSRTD